jgi:hypothetical protein
MKQVLSGVEALNATLFGIIISKHNNKCPNDGSINTIRSSGRAFSSYLQKAIYYQPEALISIVLSFYNDYYDVKLSLN